MPTCAKAAQRMHGMWLDRRMRQTLLPVGRCAGAEAHQMTFFISACRPSLGSSSLRMYLAMSSIMFMSLSCESEDAGSVVSVPLAQGTLAALPVQARCDPPHMQHAGRPPAVNPRCLCVSNSKAFLINMPSAPDSMTESAPTTQPSQWAEPTHRSEVRADFAENDWECVAAVALLGEIAKGV